MRNALNGCPGGRSAWLVVGSAKRGAELHGETDVFRGWFWWRNAGLLQPYASFTPRLERLWPSSFSRVSMMGREFLTTGNEASIRYIAFFSTEPSLPAGPLLLSPLPQWYSAYVEILQPSSAV